MNLLTDVEAVGSWVALRLGSFRVWHPKGKTAIGNLGDEGLKWGALYERYTGASIFISLAVAEPRFATRSMFRVIFSYPFNELGVGQILAEIASDNEPSLRLAKLAGFHQVAVVPKVYTASDLVLFSMSRAQCPWVEQLVG